jgi:hypothetical protein
MRSSSGIALDMVRPLLLLFKIVHHFDEVIGDASDMPGLLRLGIGRVGIGLDGHNTPYLREGIHNDAVIGTNNSESGFCFPYPTLCRSSITHPPAPAHVLSRWSG